MSKICLLDLFSNSPAPPFEMNADNFVLIKIHHLFRYFVHTSQGLLSFCNT